MVYRLLLLVLPWVDNKKVLSATTTILVFRPELAIFGYLDSYRKQVKQTISFLGKHYRRLASPTHHTPTPAVTRYHSWVGEYTGTSPYWFCRHPLNVGHLNQPRRPRPARRSLKAASQIILVRTIDAAGVFRRGHSEEWYSALSIVFTKPKPNAIRILFHRRENMWCVIEKFEQVIPDV